MASYFKLTLDTTGPSGVSLQINGDEERTTNTQLTLSIGCDDSDLTDYQMKIWSDALDMPSEANAQWENFSAEKTVEIYPELISGDTVTIYVKLRDDVWNESVIASDSIVVYTENPVVEIANISRARISKIPAPSDASIAEKLFPKNTTCIGFAVDKDCDDLRIMVVDNINALYDDPANVLIPVDGDSYIIAADTEHLNASDGLRMDSVTANTSYVAYIRGADLETASPGDGIKIVKIFAHETDGNWSI